MLQVQYNCALTVEQFPRKKQFNLKKTVMTFDKCTGKTVISWFNKEAEITVWAHKNIYLENASGQTNRDISVILLSCGNRFYRR